MSHAAFLNFFSRSEAMLAILQYYEKQGIYRARSCVLVLDGSALGVVSKFGKIHRKLHTIPVLGRFPANISQMSIHICTFQAASDQKFASYSSVVSWK